MPLQTANWEPNKDMPVGKGATIQQFFTTLGKDRFEINVAPWGEGQLKVNGQEVAKFFQHAFPHERSDLSHWRKRLGDKLELLLAESLRVAHGAGALRGQDLKRVTVDTTVQPKAITFPTDAKLHAAIKGLNRLATRHGVRLRQSYSIAAIGLGNGHAAWAAIQAHGVLLVGMGLVVTLVPLIVATLFARHVLRMNPVVTCGALAGAMTVDAAVTGACDVAESQTPVLGVAVPYAVGNVLLTVLGPIIVACTFVA
jgi:hypothetical protein